jgi:sulfur transfer protein SufE
MQAPPAVPERISSTMAKFQAASDAKERYKLMLQYAAALPAFPEQYKTAVNRVMGCTAQVWVNAELDAAGHVQLAGTSDSDLTRGMVAVLVDCLSGLTPDEVLQVGCAAHEADTAPCTS